MPATALAEPRAPTNHLGYPVCPSCRAEMMMVPNRLGAIVDRCPNPKCTGSAFKPTTSGYRLPPVEPGQLRCQVCAEGVAAQDRFCTPCARVRRSILTRRPMRPCLTCGAPTPRTRGRPKKDCEACRG
jgi:hypothetical protein